MGFDLNHIDTDPVTHERTMNFSSRSDKSTTLGMVHDSWACRMACRLCCDDFQGVFFSGCVFPGVCKGTGYVCMIPFFMCFSA